MPLNLANWVLAQLVTPTDMQNYLNANLQYLQDLHEDYVCVVEEQAQGVASHNGATFTQNTWMTRVLNTERSDANGLASLNSNQVTLQPGTWRCLISAPAHDVNNHQTRLYNITGSAVLLRGTSERAGVSASDVQTRSWIAGLFTLSVASALEVQHRHDGTGSFGAALNEGVEVYTVAEFWRVATS